MRTRILILATTIVVLVGALYALGGFSPFHFSDHFSDSVSERSPLANEDCRQCHQAVWQQWAQSRHALAWVSPDVQAAFQNFGFDRKCQSCHAPQPLFITSQASPPALREEDLQSGVNCLSCHEMSGGHSVAAKRTLSDAPCRPKKVDWLTTSQMCGVCHVAIHQDWRESRYAIAGKSCLDCHMRGQSNDSQQQTHLCLGGHDEETVRSGVTMECYQEDQELVVAITNRGVGHNFPGERHNRVLTLRVIQRKQNDKITASQQEIIKGITPFRGESAEDKIKAGETVTYRFPVNDPPVVAHVELLYKLFPWHSDHEALIVRQSSVHLTAP